MDESIGLPFEFFNTWTKYLGTRVFVGNLVLVFASGATVPAWFFVTECGI